MTKPKNPKIGDVKKSDGRIYYYMGKAVTPSGWLNKDFISKKDLETLKHKGKK